jgi:hypothetical protein
MIEIATDFPYLGARDYVHGTSVLSGFIGALERQGAANIRIRRLKFQRTARANGTMKLSSAAAAPDASAANCTLTAEADGALWHGQFVDQGLPVTRREAVAYCLTNVKAAAFAGECDFSPAGRDDLIRGLVEANKRFNEAGAGANPGRAQVQFGYLEQWDVPPSDIRFTGRLEARNLITRETPEGVLTVNRLSYAPENGPATTLVLCFNVVTGKGGDPE